MIVQKFLRGALLGLVIASVPSLQSQIILDFEIDDLGQGLANGQSISTVPDVLKGEQAFEFGQYVSITTWQLGTGGHLGAAIYDSTPGVNRRDLDLWVNKGNILILQEDRRRGRRMDPVRGWMFLRPNDEEDYEDRGGIMFNFTAPSELVSIDLVDIDAGSHLTLTLFDEEGDRRIYDVPTGWTTDPSLNTVGWQTLYLNTLAPQAAESNAEGVDATVTLNDVNFDGAAVVRLDVAFDGSAPSGGLDQLVFFQEIVPVPEPSAAALGLIGLAVLRLRRSSR